VGRRAPSVGSSAMIGVCGRSWRQRCAACCDLSSPAPTILGTLQKKKKDAVDLCGCAFRNPLFCSGLLGRCRSFHSTALLFMGGSEPHPVVGGKPHPLVAALDISISEALALQSERRMAAAAAASGVEGVSQGEGEGGGRGEAVVVVRSDDVGNDAPLDAAGCAPVVRALRAALDHGLRGNRCVEATPLLTRQTLYLPTTHRT
jgi:hypothetical protein